MMDKARQRQVWQRVYGGISSEKPLPRELMLQSQRRLRQNLRFFESQRNHPTYGPAFAHMIRQTQEQLQMLQQMLSPRQGG